MPSRSSAKRQDASWHRTVSTGVVTDKQKTYYHFYSYSIKCLKFSGIIMHHFIVYFKYIWNICIIFL